MNILSRVNREGKIPRWRGINATAANIAQTLQSQQKGNIIGVDATVDEFATNFTFPSPQDRLEHYMGDWFNRTLSPGKISCNEIGARDTLVSDTPVLWRASRLKRETGRQGRSWLIGAYLVDALDVISHSKGRDALLVLIIGDSHTHSTTLPAVAKTRFSRFAREKGREDRPFFRPIIFPMHMNRHYSPVDEYLKLQREGGETEWEDKKAALIWRGGLTGVTGKGSSDKSKLTTYAHGGPRVQVVKRYFRANTSDVDVALQAGDTVTKWAPAQYRDMNRYTRGSDTSMRDQLRYK